MLLLYRCAYEDAAGRLVQSTLVAITVALRGDGFDGRRAQWSDASLLALIDDEWAGLGDVDPELAKRTKNALAREIEGTDIPVAAAHFPGMVFGRLLAANGRRSWVV